MKNTQVYRKRAIAGLAVAGLIVFGWSVHGILADSTDTTPQPTSDDWNEGEVEYGDARDPYESPVLPPPPEDNTKSRYISIMAENVGDPVALQVKVTSSLYFPDSVGETKYVGSVTAQGYYPLISMPLVQTWPEEPLHIFDCMIHPAATFEVRAGDGASTWSDPLVVSSTPKPSQKYWGDVVGPPEDGSWTGPDGLVNMNDLMAIIQRFQSAVQAPPRHWVDLHDEGPNEIVTMSDVLIEINAFTGSKYPYDPGTSGWPCTAY